MKYKVRFSNERLITPTGLELALLAYNILRIMDQESLRKDDVAMKRGVNRRRLRTVIQHLISLASHVVNHARVFYLNLG